MHPSKDTSEDKPPIVYLINNLSPKLSTGGRNSNAKVGWVLLIEIAKSRFDIAKSCPGNAKLIDNCYLVSRLHTALGRMR
jgi:hypothetical protein